MDEERWFLVEEVADRLRVSIETVRRWIRSGALPAFDVGGPRGGYRIRESDLTEFIAERSRRPEKAVAAA